MKKVLIITYYWPPAGGPGVQRVLKFAKYLPEFGWEPVILTVKNGDYTAIDHSLSSEIRPGTLVHRSKNFEPYSIYKKFKGLKSDQFFDIDVLSQQKNQPEFKDKLINFIRKNFFIPDAKIGWLPFGILTGLKIIRKYNIDLIYSSSPPYTVSVIALLLKIFTRKKWVADFRDPWTEYLISPNRKFIAKKIDRFLEYQVFKKCDMFTCAWPGIIDIFHEKYPDVNLEKTSLIPNGYDFDLPKTSNKNEKFILSFSGSLYGKRYPEKFIENLGTLLNHNNFLKENFLLRIIGRIDTKIKSHLKTHLKDNLLVVDYLNHDKLLAYLFNSDALWLVIDDVPESRHIVAGKTYEYIGLQKPILACVPVESQTAQIIQTTNSGVCIDSNDSKQIESTLIKWIDNWKNNQDILKFNLPEIKKYKRETLAKELANVLDSIHSY